jgi:hypothetical protein
LTLLDPASPAASPAASPLFPANCILHEIRFLRKSFSENLECAVSADAIVAWRCPGWENYAKSSPHSPVAANFWERGLKMRKRLTAAGLAISALATIAYFQEKGR